MQPTENKQPTEKELIAHIRESLQAHEELYEVGAWEKFNASKPSRKKPILWLRAMGGVAALLALCFTLFLFTEKKSEEPKGKIVKNNSPAITLPQNNREELPKSVTTPKAIGKESDKKTATSAVWVARNAAPVKPGETIAEPTVTIGADKPRQPAQQIAVNPVKEQPIPSNVMAAQTEPSTAVQPQTEKPDIMDFLRKETEKDKLNAKQNTVEKRESRWELGIMVAPSFGNTKKLNMGYGLSMEYSLSDKLSLNSGIAYNEMTASKSAGDNGRAAMASSSAIAKNSRSLEAVSEKVVGLDIPLELKYHITKNVYANFGISAFAVIDSKRDNTYLEQKIVPNYLLNGSITGGAAGPAGPTGPNGPVTGPRDEVAFTNSSLVNQKVIEAAPESEQNGSSYMGFYNFSVGFKKKISKNNAFSIEPFMKLPMKEVSKNNLRLIGTGLKLKLDF